MTVEQLDVLLDAKVSPLVAGLTTADARLDATEAKMASLEAANGRASASLNGVGRSGVSAGTGLRSAERESERAGRGALAASGLFNRLGRAMAFASGAFIGGVAITGILKSVVDATRNQLQAMSQVRTALAAGGLSWRAYGGDVESTLSRLSRLSLFTKTVLAASFTRLFQSTGSVSAAERDLALATNLARSRGEDLATATQQVAQAQLGRTAVLRGLQIAVPKVTTAEDALKNTLANLKAAHEALTPAEKSHAEALARSADQARMGGRAIDVLTQKTKGGDKAFRSSADDGMAKFQKSMNDLEVSVGKVLLPDITKLIDRLSAWIEKLTKTGKAQRDAKQAADLLRSAIKLVGGAIRVTDRLTGSFKGTLELLVALKVAKTVTGWASNLGFLGTKAGGASTEVQALRTQLAELAAIGVVVVTIDVLEHLIPSKVTKGGQKILNSEGAGALGKLPLIGPVVQAGAFAGRAAAKAVGLHNASSASGIPSQYLSDPSAAEAYLEGKQNQALSFPLGGMHSGALLAAYLAGRKAGGHAVKTTSGKGSGGAAAAAGGSTAAKAKAAAAVAYALKHAHHVAPKARQHGYQPLPNQIEEALSNAQAAVSAAGGASGTGTNGSFTPAQIAAMKNLEEQQRRALGYLNATKVTGAALVKVDKERATIASQLAATEREISKAMKSQQQAAIALREEKILGLAPGGGQITPGRSALIQREHKLLEASIATAFGGKSHSIAVAAQNIGVDVTTLLHKTNAQLISEMKKLGVDLPKATLESLNKVNAVLKNKFLPPDVRDNIRARLAQIEETLKSSAKTLASNYKPVHSTDIVKGLGLDRAAKLAVEQRVSQAMAHAGYAPTGGAAAGVPLPSGVAAGGSVQYVTYGDVTIQIDAAGKDGAKLAREIRAELKKVEHRSGGRKPVPG